MNHLSYNSARQSTPDNAPPNLSRSGIPDLSQNGNMSGGRFSRLSQNVSFGDISRQRAESSACHKKSKPRSSTVREQKLLPDLIKAAIAMPEEQFAEAMTKCGVALQTESGERQGVDRVFLIQHRFGVSKRSAYRHLKRGTLPDKERRIGGDGKLYSLPQCVRRSKVWRELGLSSQALRRADSIACEAGVDDGEISRLSDLVKLATAILAQWRAGA